MLKVLVPCCTTNTPHFLFPLSALLDYLDLWAVLYPGRVKLSLGSERTNLIRWVGHAFCQKWILCHLLDCFTLNSALPLVGHGQSQSSDDVLTCKQNLDIVGGHGRSDFQQLNWKIRGCCAHILRETCLQAVALWRAEPRSELTEHRTLAGCGAADSLFKSMMLGDQTQSKFSRCLTFNLKMPIYYHHYFCCFTSSWLKVHRLGSTCTVCTTQCWTRRKTLFHNSFYSCTTRLLKTTSDSLWAPKSPLYLLVACNLTDWWTVCTVVCALRTGIQS